MAKFVFELEALLRKRLHDEREQMGRVAAIERERIALEDEIRGYQSMIIEEKEDLAARLSVERDGAAPPDEWAEPPGRSVDLRAVRMQANASLRLIDRAQRAVLRLKGVHDRHAACTRRREHSGGRSEAAAKRGDVVAEGMAEAALVEEVALPINHDERHAARTRHLVRERLGGGNGELVHDLHACVVACWTASAAHGLAVRSAVHVRRDAHGQRSALLTVTASCRIVWISKRFHHDPL